MGRNRSMFADVARGAALFAAGAFCSAAMQYAKAGPAGVRPGPAMLSGRVVGKDAPNKRLLLRTRDAEVWVQCPETATLIRQCEQRPEALAIGDTVMVEGFPTALDAASVTARPPAPAPRQAAGGAPAAPNARGGLRVAGVSLTGKVAAVQPALLVEIDGGRRVAVATDAKTRVVRVAPVGVRDAVAGDLVRLTGTAGNDGTVVVRSATLVEPALAAAVGMGDPFPAATMAPGGAFYLPLTGGELQGITFTRTDEAGRTQTVSFQGSGAGSFTSQMQTTAP